MTSSLTGGAGGLDSYRQLAEALPHLVWLARADGTVTFYNSRIELYGGLGPGPSGTYDWAPIVHPDDLDRTQQAWRHAVDTGQEYECDLP